MNRSFEVYRFLVWIYLVLVNTVILVGCDGSSDANVQNSSSDKREPGPVSIVKWEDSAWAADVAKRAFQEEIQPGELKVTGYRFENGEHLVRISDTTMSLGGAATIGVKPDGTTRIVEVYQ